MIYLIRHIEHKPTVVTVAQLEPGFVCFSLFCLTSTFGALALPVPAAASASIGDVDTSQGRGFLSRHAKTFVLPLGVAFFVCFGLGIYWPTMGIRLDMDSIKIPDSLKFALHDIGLDRLVRDDVSALKCAFTSIGWIAEGEASLMVACVLMWIFVILVPVLDVLILLATALTYKKPDSLEGKQKLPRGMIVSHYMNHVAMADVYLAGVVVVVLSGSSYPGAKLFLSSGVIPMACAVAIHYCLYYVVGAIAGTYE